MKNHYFNYKIMSEDNGLPIKKILTCRLGLTAAKIRSVKFDSEGILLDGERVPVTKRVCIGQMLSVLLNDSEQKDTHLIPQPMALQILYEDEDLLILNKPAGIVSHPSRGHLTDSLANGVLSYFQEKDERSNIHLLGRLDKDTSGVLTIAKNGATADFLARQRDSGQFFKTYYALVLGAPPANGTITTPMEAYRTGDGLLKMKEASVGGLHALTHYETLSQHDGYALVRCTIETGRTHQIRFHMASIGHPLLGDPLYGVTGEAPGVPKLSHTALHAGDVQFIHPYTKEKLRIEAPLPEIFQIKNSV